MQTYRKYFILFFMVFGAINSYAQNPKIDNLEMLFAQNHYRKVYRKANRLLDNPEFDFSMMPTYYKSLSLLQLAQNDYWLKKHPSAIQDAKKGIIAVRNSDQGKSIFLAHQNELSWLKEDLISWASDLKRMGNDKVFQEVQDVLKAVFEQVVFEQINDVRPTVSNNSSSVEVVTKDDIPSQVVGTAEQYLGTPYVWAGSSPSGFDCSGFTSYVLKEYNVQLPRRAEDQYKMAKKVKRKDVQKGDLVFFKNGGNVSHVGIIVSDKGEPLVMIHASSSKGIITTNINDSSYWSERLYAFGRVLN